MSTYNVFNHSASASSPASRNRTFNSQISCPLKTFISSHFFGKNGAENIAMRDQGPCVAARLFAEEINTESDLVGENLATKGDNKLNISSAKVGEKPPNSHRVWHPHQDASRARGQVGREVVALA